MQKLRITALAIALAGAALSLGGCATEDYVDKHIAVVNQRIDGLEAKVQQVDGVATQANQIAQSALGSAQQGIQRLDQLTGQSGQHRAALGGKETSGLTTALSGS